jgi:uncharacterized membrane protein YagU involved in acid resistance
MAVGAAAAGTLHLAYAFLTAGWSIPLAITGGLLGPQVFTTGGAAPWALGVLLHFSFAVAMAAFYYWASRRLRFLSDHWLVCGIYYGITVWMVMHLVVLPLSALHNPGPYSASDEVVGLVEHMFTVGLPIAYSVRRYAP